MLQRSKEETILFMLGGSTIVSVLPFGVVRILQGNWVLAAVDLSIVFMISAIIVFVWFTQKIRAASILATIFYSIGMLASVYVKGQVIVYWVYPTMIAAFFMLNAREALLINTVSLSVLMEILFGRMSFLDLSSVAITLVLINLFSYIFSYRTNLQHLELNHQAELDFLTGVGNRRAFNRKMTELFRPHNARIDACLFVLDLDHFKYVNDQFGHAVGDQVLVKFCELMRSRIRAIDSMFRFGGEEFVIVTMRTDQESAKTLAEELRSLVETTVLIPNYQVTVSIGVAKRCEAECSDAWFQRADGMLYEAKQSGRNQVSMAD
ncbi:GGDEF domain-containing protein [Undibacterium parvum]|uniref:diguanylate cyclase n=1 Tax=Undibacterium parvum TaxID=401471 RepID=A0A3S9HEY7_9BURK|nr:GGDEF domain-containing protein [Undibacterium parvum]AZP10689.1 GGDEF domain-containing protein [Undibacterium parvum]